MGLLELLIVILLVLWICGVATAVTADGLIHILLVVALIILVFRVIEWRRPPPPLP